MSAVVLVPGAPVLVPELAGLAAAESADRVDRVVDLLRTAATTARRVLVLGEDEHGRALGDVRADLRRWGRPVEVGRPGVPTARDGDVPASALLGWWFLDRARIALPRAFAPVGRASTAGPATDHRSGDVLLVVVADGPASLDARGPVPVDPRGVDLDAELGEWLARGGRLPDPGPEVARAVGWRSRGAWTELAALVAGRPAVTSLAWAPFGVGYHAALWTGAAQGPEDTTGAGEQR